MNKESKKLIEKLDVLAQKIDTLTLVTAIGMQKEKLFKGMSQKKQIKFLHELGLNRNIIALILRTTPLTVSVTLSKMKKKKGKKAKAKPKEESKQEEKVEQL